MALIPTMARIKYNQTIAASSQLGDAPVELQPEVLKVVQSPVIQYPNYDAEESNSADDEGWDDSSTTTEPEAMQLLNESEDPEDVGLEINMQDMGSENDTQATVLDAHGPSRVVSSDTFICNFLSCDREGNNSASSNSSSSEQGSLEDDEAHHSAASRGELFEFKRDEFPTPPTLSDEEVISTTATSGGSSWPNCWWIFSSDYPISFTHPLWLSLCFYH